MSDILKRLMHIAKSYVFQDTGMFTKESGKASSFHYENKEYNDTDTSFTNYSKKRKESKENHRSSFDGFAQGNNYYGVPKQVIADLLTFNLKPPSCMEDVRRARNREMKKYHSDKFINDPEKLKTSKEIMQIYNAAYERLMEYYKNK